MNCESPKLDFGRAFKTKRLESMRGGKNFWWKGKI